jgi:twinkle protein
MSYLDFNIQIPYGKTTGEITTICPRCSHTRKKSKDKCLGVNLDKKVWRCNHCNWSGFLKNDIQKVEYKKPKWINKTELSTKVVQWFEVRKISQNTLLKAKITDSIEWMPQTQKEENTINFNYFRNEELINIKYRDGKKNFKLYKDAELIFYNLDSIKDKSQCFIVEGEIDALSLIEAGIDNVVSVPNGATTTTNNLTYLDNCYDYFLDKTEIILWLDNDTAGRKLKYDIAERLGFERCKFIEIEDCKDANEYLVKYGLNAVITIQNKAQYFPLEGVYTISDVSNEIDDMYLNGLDRGVSTEIPNFNLNFVKGYLTVITGIPSHGKSDFLDYICLQLRIKHNWRGCFYSPENRPTQLHFSKMVRKISGKHWDGFDRISINEVNEIKEYLDRYVWFLKPEKDFTLTSILNQIKAIKQRYGLEYFVIDAWNKIEHADDKTSYIGKCLDEIVTFCEINNVHCFLVAHPTKIKKSVTTGKYEVPTLYDIAGSANFYNKADNGICVYRDFEQEKTFVYVQKIKFDHWGTEGCATFSYDVKSKRYQSDIMDLQSWIKPQSLYEEMKQYVQTKKSDDTVFDIF